MNLFPSRRRATIRAEAMRWSIMTAQLGEDALMILARAQLYEDWVNGAIAMETRRAIDSKAGVAAKP